MWFKGGGYVPIVAGVLMAIAYVAICLWSETAWSQSGIGDKIRSFFPGLATPQPPRLVLVFVDISGSIPPDDWNIYESTFFSLVGRSAEGRENEAALKKGPQDKPGDRLVLGTITEATLTKFAPVAEGELRDTGYIGVDRDSNEATLKALHAAFGTIKTMKHARRTLILDAVTLSQQLIEGNPDRRNVIVILSDMLEDSDTANFEKKPPTPADTEAIIRKQRARNLLPDLHQAQIFVAGAKAPTAAQFEEVEAFWTRYFREANGVVGTGAYGRPAIDFATAWRE